MQPTVRHFPSAPTLDVITAQGWRGTVDPRQLFTDIRLPQRCALCGIGPPATRDHVPARVFLDEPLPGHYPVVAVCERCNQDASKDEEYVACVIDAALQGTVIDIALLRPKVAAALTHSQPLADRLRRAEHRGGDGKCIGFDCESARMRRVLEKIGRGLIAFDDGDAQVGSDAEVIWSALGQMTRPGSLRLHERPFSVAAGGRVTGAHSPGKDRVRQSAAVDDTAAWTVLIPRGSAPGGRSWRKNALQRLLGCTMRLLYLTLGTGKRALS